MEKGKMSSSQNVIICTLPFGTLEILNAAQIDIIL
jgi:hypothetical protein